jgi:predicted benzoate:H+ symporter BenE
MKLDTLRMIVGFSIISAHLLSFALILLGAGNLTPSERVELSILISPVFAVYVTAIVRQFTKLDTAFDDTPTHPALVTLSIGTAAIFSLATPLTLFLFINGRVESFAALKTTFGIIETALGIYTGAVIDRLFGSTPRRNRRRDSMK